jgi:hypothetical protein
MSDRFLEQRIKVTFYSELGKNASDTCAMLSESCGREAVKIQKPLNGINGSKIVARMWKVLKELVAQDFVEHLKMLKSV